MSELDQKIAETLKAEDRALMDQLGEQGLFGQLGGLFQGKLKWVSIATVVFGLFMTAIAIYAAWKFITIDDTNEMLRWAGLAWLGSIVQLAIKQWSWMRMETNRNIREIKRLELQMARLLEKTSN